MPLYFVAIETWHRTIYYLVTADDETDALEQVKEKERENYKENAIRITQLDGMYRLEPKEYKDCDITYINLHSC